MPRLNKLTLRLKGSKTWDSRLLGDDVPPDQQSELSDDACQTLCRLASRTHLSCSLRTSTKVHVDTLLCLSTIPQLEHRSTALGRLSCAPYTSTLWGTFYALQGLEVNIDTLGGIGAAQIVFLLDALRAPQLAVLRIVSASPLPATFIRHLFTAVSHFSLLAVLSIDMRAVESRKRTTVPFDASILLPLAGLPHLTSLALIDIPVAFTPDIFSALLPAWPKLASFTYLSERTDTDGARSALPLDIFPAFAAHPTLEDMHVELEAVSADWMHAQENISSSRLHTLSLCHCAIDEAAVPHVAAFLAALFPHARFQMSGP